MNSFVRSLALLAAGSLSCGRTEALRWDANAQAGGDAVATVSHGQNACGGTAALEVFPGEPCGVCGAWVCASADRLECDDREPRNACGRCGPVPREECNERDDDCDGLVDEGCVRRLGVFSQHETRVRVSGSRAVIEVQGLGLAIVTIGTQQIEYVRAPVGDAGPIAELTDSAIDGDLLAWTEYRYSAPSSHVLRVRELSTGRQWTLEDAPLLADQPAIDRGRVAYRVRASDNSPSDVRVWDRATERKTLLETRDASESNPALSDAWLVFVRQTTLGPNAELRARNLQTGEERFLSQGLSGVATAPDAAGDRVVWAQDAGSSSSPSTASSIQLYEFSSGMRRALTEPGSRFFPRISGSLVCWTPFPSPRVDVGSPSGTLVVFDVLTRNALALSERAVGCDLDARRVVLLENTYNADAYFRDLLPGEP